jgi:hypothetical protein
MSKELEAKYTGQSCTLLNMQKELKEAVVIGDWPGLAYVKCLDGTCSMILTWEMAETIMESDKVFDSDKFLYDSPKLTP